MTPLLFSLLLLFPMTVFEYRQWFQPVDLPLELVMAGPMRTNVVASAAAAVAAREDLAAAAVRAAEDSVVAVVRAAAASVAVVRAAD